MIARYYFKDVGFVKLDVVINTNFGATYYVVTHTCKGSKIHETFYDYKQAEIAFHLEVVKLINSIDKEVNA